MATVREVAANQAEIQQELAKILGVLKDRGSIVDNYAEFKAETLLHIERLIKVVDGNGKGSVPDRLTRLEGTVANTNKEVSQLEKKIDRAGWWVITTLVAFLLTIITFVVKSNMP